MRMFLLLFIFIILVFKVEHCIRQINMQDVYSLNIDDDFSVRFLDCNNESQFVDKDKSWHTIKSFLEDAKKTNRIGLKGNSWGEYFKLQIEKENKIIELDFLSRSVLYQEEKARFVELKIIYEMGSSHYGHYKCDSLFYYLDEAFNSDNLCFNDLSN